MMLPVFPLGCTLLPGDMPTLAARAGADVLMLRYGARFEAEGR